MKFQMFFGRLSWNFVVFLRFFEVWQVLILNFEVAIKSLFTVLLVGSTFEIPKMGSTDENFVSECVPG
jgi:hypothetical protein